MDPGVLETTPKRKPQLAGLGGGELGPLHLGFTLGQRAPG